MIPKFRAWDWRDNKMFEPTFRAYAGELEDLMISLEGDLIMHTMEGNVHESMFPDRFKLMQSTGLKDDNDKEIYEGDVVQFISFEENSAFVGNVVFAGGAFCVNAKLEEANRNYNVPLVESQNSRFNFIINILGNIYENPELFEVQG